MVTLFFSILFTCSLSFSSDAFDIENMDFEFDELPEENFTPDEDTTEEEFSFDSLETEALGEGLELEEALETQPKKIETKNPLEESNKTQKKKAKASNHRYIYHPNQEKGLYKINRSHEYIYKYKKSPISQGFQLTYGSINFEQFRAENSDQNFFRDFYEKNTLPTLFLEYSLTPFKKFKSLTLTFGSGLNYVRGSGKFVDNTNSTQSALESYTFLFLPNSVGLKYSYKYGNAPLIVPYIAGALNYNFIIEFRSGFEALKYSGVLGAHFGGGLGLNLGWLERSASLNLDTEFGINSSYLLVEVRNLLSFEAEKDFGGTLFLVGLGFEF